MEMAKKLEIHRQIEEADKAHRERYFGSWADAINLTLDMYMNGEIGLKDLKRTAEELYDELNND